MDEIINSSLKKFGIIFLIAGILAIIAINLNLGGVIVGYTYLRAYPFIGNNFLLIFMNNFVVIVLTLLGGALFSIAEIKSYEKLPDRIYYILDHLAAPLHKFFSIFDKRIDHLKPPFKSCYFLLVSFPVLVLFINFFLFISLMLIAILEKNANLGVILRVMPIALMEFLCILIASGIALNFSQRAFLVLKKNDIDEFLRISVEFINSKRNLKIILLLSLILLLSAYIEDLIIR
ncbi:MAG: hypothetical protein DRO90_00700 [Candidatus Altiarchaeales archaeon]|nr:MAG: hypothetical protein DRO95_04260 [Candidatus Altiarchaeales archaeon]RLI94148.1 MAG: hypothetical protein DRO94_03540 [Candidatus Altiarchaeales archaeon]RLI95207.1 MAG: hypothetical protein DRO90_00700 [Candidatus Altiarchaeales archaeon]HDO82323.1 hypothetical protein [Candidatus Altiarchaeales archaeon]HEX54972.1 hypothetical protein [Candidatus Altiarchaeales archaeon]